MNKSIQNYFNQIKLPDQKTHKGENGKLLIIGGSDLFHAASKWSLDVASKFVDMVFYASTPENNELIKQVKGEFWNGIVIGRETAEDYLQEADAVLIGPGMTRNLDGLRITDYEFVNRKSRSEKQGGLEKDEWNDTYKVVNYLLSKYPNKKWVVDAGALQMIEPELLTDSCIITPHKTEMLNLLEKASLKVQSSNVKVQINDKCQMLKNKIREFENLDFICHLDFEICNLRNIGITTLLKGPTDFVFQGDNVIPITGGNPGMTKGGTGDVLAGIVAALYCKHDAVTSAVVGSYVNKAAGDSLYQRVGPYFNASDLVQEIPEVFWKLITADSLTKD